jgi:hypothetical protein
MNPRYLCFLLVLVSVAVFPSLAFPSQTRLSITFSSQTRNQQRTRQHPALLLLQSHPEGLESVVANIQTSIAENGHVNIETSETLSVDTTNLDPAILAAGAVAFVALVALLNMNDDTAEEETTSQTQESTALRESKHAFKELVTSKKKDDESKPKLVILSSAESKTDQILDDLVEEETKALEAFETQNEARMRASLSYLMSLVRMTRSLLSKEETLRKEAETELQSVAQEIRDLEDKYELEQNVLKRKQLELQQAQSTLKTTQKGLKEASESLADLEEERKSLRKLGRVAWQLSKQRMQTRLSNIRDRFQNSEKSSDSADQEPTE